ncbi:unnamed protein product [Sympodiomycopsis kandeliae]
MGSDRPDSSSSRSRSRLQDEEPSDKSEVRHRSHHREGRHRDRDHDHDRRDPESRHRLSRDGHRERDSHHSSSRDHHHDRHGHSNSSRHGSSSRRDAHDHRHRHRSDGERKRHSDRRSSPLSSKRRKEDSSDNGHSATTIVDDDVRGKPALMPEDAVNSASDARPNFGDEAASMIPSSQTLQLNSHPEPSYSDTPAPLVENAPTGTALKRDDWMLDRPQATTDPVGSMLASEEQPSNADLRAEGVSGQVEETRADAPNGGDDFFSSLGRERIKQPKDDKPDPEKLHVSSRELNSQFAEGKQLDNYSWQPKRKLDFGSPGYQWRMMKLRKTYEQADEEGRSVDEVAMERYGDAASFQEAKDEREWLDRNARSGSKAAASRSQRPGQSRDGTPQQQPQSKRSFMFTDNQTGSGPPSRPISRQSFRRPGESSTSSTPQALSRTNSKADIATEPPAASKPATPIPSVFTPIASKPANNQPSSSSQAAVEAAVETSQARDTVSNAPMDAEGLNKLEAKVMKAEMMGKANASSLREKLEREKARAQKGGDQGEGYFDQGGVGVHPSGSDGNSATQIQVLPTLDGRGQLYDIGSGKSSGQTVPPGNRRKKDKVETHDPKTGEFMRYNADDDETTLEDMVRQERFKAGSGSQKNYDSEMANRIATDGAFKESFDYLDENAERIARKKMRSDALKRQFAINDFAKTKKALESCRFCFQNEGESPPLARVVASGTRAYLCVPETEPLVPGHCLIVPIQHHLSTLEAEDDTWEEIKNFMKCLLQQAASKNQGVIFYETVTSLKHQRHTYIEAVPLSHDLISTLPGNFRQELLSVESEWSTHQKIISFNASKPFRRSMVPDLPYFMIQFDHKGEKGYGHIIENETNTAFEEEQDPYGMSEQSRGTAGGKFERYFAAEVIGGLLDIEPRMWMRPRRVDHKRGAEMLAKYKKEWDPFDWTKMLREQPSQQ